MQPHSMCAVAMANYIWNSTYRVEPKSATLRVEYLNRYKEHKTNVYRLSNIQQSSDGREFSVYIIRDGGGISCTITVRRSSVLEGARVEMSHSENHVSGLREEFVLWKNKIANGRHYNSLLYREFKGEQPSSDSKKLRLETEVKIIPKVPYAHTAPITPQWVEITKTPTSEAYHWHEYKLEIESIN